MQSRGLTPVKIIARSHDLRLPGSHRVVLPRLFLPCLGDPPGDPLERLAIRHGRSPRPPKCPDGASQCTLKKGKSVTPSKPKKSKAEQFRGALPLLLELVRSRRGLL